MLRAVQQRHPRPRAVAAGQSQQPGKLRIESTAVIEMGARYGGARRNGYWRKLLGDQRLGWVEKLDAKLIVATDHLGRGICSMAGPPK